MNETNLKIYTAMKQVEYRELKDHCTTTSFGDSDRYGLISDDVAKDIIMRQFGFDESKIEITHHISMYEQTKDGTYAKCGTGNRVPCYAASDWNYIRFDVCGYTYELVNDSLNIVCD